MGTPAPKDGAQLAPFWSSKAFREPGLAEYGGTVRSVRETVVCSAATACRVRNEAAFRRQVIVDRSTQHMWPAARPSSA